MDWCWAPSAKDAWPWISSGARPSPHHHIGRRSCARSSAHSKLVAGQARTSPHLVLSAFPAVTTTPHLTFTRQFVETTVTVYWPGFDQDDRQAATRPQRSCADRIKLWQIRPRTEWPTSGAMFYTGSPSLAAGCLQTSGTSICDLLTVASCMSHESDCRHIMEDARSVMQDCPWLDAIPDHLKDNSHSLSTSRRQLKHFYFSCCSTPNALYKSSTYLLTLRLWSQDSGSVKIQS